MSSHDSRNSEKYINSSTRNTFEKNNNDEATELRHGKNEPNLSNINLNINNNRTNVENLRLPASLDAIINLMTSLIERGYREAYLIVELRHSNNPREFISHTVIRRHNFYQWFRNILDNGCINTTFEEYTNHNPIVVRIIMSLCAEHVAELTNEFEYQHLYPKSVSKASAKMYKTYQSHTSPPPFYCSDPRKTNLKCITKVGHQNTPAM